MNTALYLLGAIFLLSASFVWGASTMHNHVWPHSLLQKFVKQPVSEERGMANRQRRSIFEIFTEQKDLVFLGDSITEQAPWEEMFPGVAIANRGIGGERFENMLSRLDDIVALQPKAVFLMGGVNNASSNDLHLAMSAFSGIVESLRDNGIYVYLQATIEPQGSRRPFVQRLNIEIRRYAEKNGLVLINTASLSDYQGLKSEFTLDGTHLNGRGMKTWQQILEPYVAAALER
jgi:lysophospholipase L1-like esterase